MKKCGFLGCGLALLLASPWTAARDTSCSRDVDAQTRQAPQPVLSWQPIRFAHLSNSGGSTVCALARRVLPTPVDNNITLQVPSCGNCNGPLRGPQQWGLWVAAARRGMRVTCNDLAALARTRSYSILASEGLLEEMVWPHPAPCPQFRYFMVVKHPVSRLVNNFIRMEPNHTATHALLEITARNGTHPCFTGRQRLFCVFMLSNANVRFLLGTDTFVLPWQEVQLPHLERARGLLRQFELVLPLERLSAPESRALMQKHLGWPMHRLSAVHQNHHRPSDGTPPVVGKWGFPGIYAALADRTMELIVKLNALDLDLHAWVAREWDLAASELRAVKVDQENT